MCLLCLWIRNSDGKFQKIRLHEHGKYLNMATYTLKITLKEIQPEIERTVQVSSESSLYLLHHIIQQAMGWECSHLYHFTVEKLTIGDLRLLLSDGYDEMGMNPVDDKNYMLEDIFQQVGQKIDYLYDYGDDWEHEIELMAIENDPQYLVLPLLLNGKNACPPEDCGGTHGYQEIKEILKNVRHKEYAATLGYVGAKFHPEKFDKKSALKRFSKLNELIIQYERGFL